MSTVYIVILTYIKPLEEIDAAIPAHVEWLKKRVCRGNFPRIRKTGAEKRWGHSREM